MNNTKTVYLIVSNIDMKNQLITIFKFKNMKKPNGISIFKLTPNSIQQILSVWICKLNCKVVQDCNGSCKSN